MRKALVAISMAAFAVATIGTASAAPKMTKMGCMVGKQTYDASQGKCVDKTTVKKASKKVVKKAS